MDIFVLPAPPVLHPVAAAGASPELNNLRAAVYKLLLSAFEHESVLVICEGSLTARVDRRKGDLRAFGIPTAVAELPTRLTIDNTSLSSLGATGALPVPLIVLFKNLEAVASATLKCASAALLQVGPEDPVALASHLRLTNPPVRESCIVVVGELSARRGGSRYASLSSTPAAQVFDHAFARSFEAGDVASMDQLLAEEGEGMVASVARPMRMALAVSKALRFSGGDIEYHEAPYGVTYLAGCLPEKR